jgi:hypothetical protein
MIGSFIDFFKFQARKEWGKIKAYMWGGDEAQNFYIKIFFPLLISREKK